MLLAVLVVQQRFARGALFQRFIRNFDGVAFRFPIEHDHFQRGEGGAGVAVGKNGNGFQHAGRHVDGLTAESSGIVQGPLEQILEVLRGKLMKNKYLAT